MDGFSKISTSNVATLAISTVMVAAAHPLTYVKVLIQVGYEPISPHRVTTFFGKTVYRLPNVLEYAGHIKAVDGWFGLYRGLGARIAHNIVNSSVKNSISNTLTEQEKDKSKVSEKSLQTFLKEVGNEAVAKSAGLFVSYPLQLISIRMMVQFVGRETEYRSLFSSFKEIYKEEGILGFFSGIVPHLLGELFLLWLCKSMNFCVQKYIISEEYSQIPEVRSYTHSISQYIASIVTYPFTLVTNIMAINHSKLAAGNPPLTPIYLSWTDCWIDLGKKGLRSRGSTLFRRNVSI
ncbi:mitochondrial carrier homolog 2 isoform X2 [Hydra vulgaris]|uniref:Mitochondrial carrier homolog 2 isoform X2 n=1 Tax=Hydra vulgaris TaxID=6087 RepID=A0ABM4D3P5_HYDVU